MSTTVTYAGNQYNVPAYQDTGYAQGTGNLSSYLIALATGSLTVSGGSFPLTADADFGANFGLKSIYYKSRDANVATVGVIRLGSAEVIAWRNNAHGGDLPLTTNASDQLTFNGHVIATSTGALDGTNLTLTDTTNQMLIGTTNTTTLSFTAPASSRTYTIPDAGGNVQFVMAGGTQTIAGAKTFSTAVTINPTTNQLVLGVTNTTTISATAPASSSVYTIPDVGTTANFILSAGNQTIAGVKTFSSGVLITATSNHLVLSTATQTLTINANTQASARVWSIPDISSAGTFAALEGTQTFTGTKTFSAQIISTATSNHLKLATASNNAIISVASIATADRTITIPDPGTNANFVLSEATATINGVKTFGNDAIFNGDVYTTVFTDYSGTSTVVGWSSFGTKLIFYKKIGKVVFIWFSLAGTSNATNATFTLPFSVNASIGINHIIRSSDNGGSAVAGIANTGASSSTVTLFSTVAAAAWTASGAKNIEGFFSYQAT